ncbi:MAG: hypothetical protein JWP97_3652 [Labilithrix sp.]|nr:hypothetical protein [Labilithrix sp.]
MNVSRSTGFALFAACVALASASCGGATDSGLVDGTSDASADDGGSSGASSSGSSGASSSSGGTDAAVDAAPAESPFTGAPAYVATTGRSTFQREHPNGGNPSKRACFDCHGGSGPGPDFFAAGSVFSDAAGTVPAAQVEIRFRDDSGHALSTYSDKLGNFLITKQSASAAGVTFPLHAGARNATTTKLMTEITPKGDCNNAACHGGAQGFIHLP